MQTDGEIILAVWFSLPVSQAKKITHTKWQHLLSRIKKDKKGKKYTSQDLKPRSRGSIVVWLIGVTTSVLHELISFPEFLCHFSLPSSQLLVKSGQIVESAKKGVQKLSISTWKKNSKLYVFKTFTLCLKFYIISINISK